MSVSFAVKEKDENKVKKSEKTKGKIGHLITIVGFFFSSWSEGGGAGLEIIKKHVYISKVPKTLREKPLIRLLISFWNHKVYKRDWN